MRHSFIAGETDVGAADDDDADKSSPLESFVCVW